MHEFVEDLCETIGTKSVTRTDKNKGAFVLNEALRLVLETAGYFPGEGGGNATYLTLHVLNEANGLKLDVSYYNSVRKGAGRTPETRMGRDIVHWMEVGDLISIANIGPTVFVWRGQIKESPLNEIAGEIAGEIDTANLMLRARDATGKPSKVRKQINDFRRNVAVVAGALARANGQCEMPACDRELFERPDGSLYLEVHHVLPLAEGGEDTMSNAAALCPTCHRELHYGKLKLEKRKTLSNAINAKEA